MKTVITILIIAFIGRSIAVKTLDLDDFDLEEDELAEEVARTLKNNGEYTDVDFYGKSITLEGALAIANVLSTTVLTSLNLGNNKIGAEGVSAILNASKTSRIDDLNLDRTLEEGEVLSFPALLENSKMSRLSLSNNKLTEDHAMGIAKVLDRTGITTLDLGWNPMIGTKGVVAILTASKTHPIEHLGLSETAFGQWGVIPIASLLVDTKITSLDLSKNGIQEETAVKIVEATKHTRITSLDLSQNEIPGMKISAALNYSNITNLVLHGCKFGDGGAIALAKVLPNTCIVYLYLRDNRIGAEGMKALAESLPNTLVTELLPTWGALGKPLRDKVEKILKENKVRIDGLYKEFKELVVERNGSLEFADGIDPQRRAKFTEIISGKGQGYIKHFSDNEDGSFTREQIEEFILRIAPPPVVTVGPNPPLARNKTKDRLNEFVLNIDTQLEITFP